MLLKSITPRRVFLFRRTLASAVFAAAAFLAGSCSTTRVLDDGEFRLAKNNVEITNDSRFSSKDLESYVKQRPNTYLFFGWNPFLILYNWSGKDKGKWLNRFIRQIGVAPVVYDPTQVDASLENIGRHLEYLGYYGSKVGSEINVNKKTVEVNYTVTLGDRYRISDLTYSVPEGEFSRDFFADTSNISIKKGDFLSEDALEKESERSAAYFRRSGYFGFTKNYFSFEADTLRGADTASLIMTVKEYTRNQTPESARPLRKYTIGNVSVSYDKALNFNDHLLRDLNTIKPGARYDELDVNNTYSRFSSLKLFSGVNIGMTPRDSLDIVDCNINLTRSRLQGFKINLEGSTNSSGLIGVSPQLSYYHKNIFNGGQWLNLSFLGNFQFKANDRSIKSNELGVTSSVSFPEIIGLPNSLFKGPSIPRTEINASYNFQSRPEYTRNMISTSYGYSGSLRNGKFFYQIYPLQAKIVRLYNMDPAFYKTISGNPFMRDSYQNHFDVGSGATAYYTTSTELNPKTTYEYARLQLDASGNVFSLFNGGMKTDDYGSRLIWGTPYSQYIRAELTLGKTFFFGMDDRRSIATRLLCGFGYAYGNSSALPFEKQFYSGGANSMRGWQSRALGPGRAKADTTFAIPSQTGDMKIEANVEYRFPMFWKLNGALFTDIGNVWTLQDSADSKDYTQFKLEDIARSIAADWGFGIRLDLSFLILRIDLGMKLYDPSLDSSRWFGPSSWLRKDSFAVHFGVGHPF